MCVIALYDMINEPTLDNVQKMIDANPDGCGVAYNDGERVTFVKGIKHAKTVVNAYHKAKKLGAKYFVFHARIATSGGISPQKCHPFILSDKRRELDATSGSIKAPVVFHNGIFDIAIEDGLSDTQTFVKRAVYPLYKACKTAFTRGDFDEVLEQATNGSRVVVLEPDGVKVYGYWRERDGVLYSNLNWEYTYHRDWWQYYYDKQSEYDNAEADAYGGYLPAKYRTSAGGGKAGCLLD